MNEVLKSQTLNKFAFAIVAMMSFFVGCAAKPVTPGTEGPAAMNGSVPTVGDDEITGILSKICQRHALPAMAAAIVTSQGLQKVGAVGVRKWGTNVPVTLDDMWHLGSDTKIMTSTLAAIMVEQGKLKWTSTVSDVFPELAASFHPDLRNVSLIQLLSHRAGLPANIDYDAINKTHFIQAQRIDAVKEGLSRKPLSAPGSEFLYSNLGYIIAGAMIERASGMDWESAIKKYVFTPLGMTSAGFGGLGTPGQIDQPWGHVKSKQPVLGNGPDVDNPPVLGPAGRVHCTIQDWAKFIQDQLRGARGEPALLKPESYQMLQTPHFGGDYALGWIVVQRDWAGGTALTHTGSNTFFLALVWIAPSRDFAILVCTNEGTDSFGAADEAVSQIIQIVNRK